MHSDATEAQRVQRALADSLFQQASTPIYLTAAPAALVLLAGLQWMRSPVAAVPIWLAGHLGICAVQAYLAWSYRRRGGTEPAERWLARFEWTLMICGGSLVAATVLFFDASAPESNALLMIFLACVGAISI